MATQIINHTYKLKRGNQDAVEKANPILQSGEPVVVFCNDGKTRLKIGDGVTEYKLLNFIGEGEGSGQNEPEIINRPYKEDFDNVGNPNKIYKAEKEQQLYQWNPNTSSYEKLDAEDVNITIDNIDIISGGSVEDLLK